MKKLTLLTVALFLSSVTPAVAQEVRYDFDKDKDFSKYKTYKWVPIKGADMPDELTQKALTSAIDTELAAKGMTKTDSDNADVLVGYQTALGQEKEYTSYNTGWGYGTGCGEGWYGSGGGMSSTTTYGSMSTVYAGKPNVSMYTLAASQTSR